MLEWFDLTNVEVRPKEKKANQEQQSEEYSPNASAESLNAKIKDFRAQLRGVIDKKFFIFRLVKIFG